ncbi:bifunctional 4-hydroxy-2-oxoglutarate aldolase/2-dehydro-3-deoxy-phosphogluconate aldolase [Calothrix sp. 336/3]|uniref:bifunctional 4-hydroxy-2-oxoglutarate aldolase/2-dehydro-3-deoxy-phosphogluconate aldolase n=1 Tax=Calothrix sp. 336/3 TaxID=1337936 RepID=UPI0004E2F1C7|nr:bifunctional 4-hydroxy-2-oxoglutarate aldolase/2-dehydro-3-deoxy-phosphogluconate aldolase [Calothrix sp. 336/3]AKG23100.1 hypothetical protein IJ00_19130 [Calothrix sp. 336/3]
MELHQSWLTLVKKYRAIAVIRAPEISLGKKMALAMAAAGMDLIEITWNSDRPAELINILQAELPDCVIGAGTLLHRQHLQEAIATGAKFLFTPHLDVEMLAIARQENIPIIPGALTPTEIVTAWQYGASCVKVFPVSSLGGISYIKSLRAPLPQIPLIPTGGVTLDNAQDFIKAGAVAVGLSGELFPQELVASNNWQAIAARAQKLRQTLS